jgi:hypothetical protein
MALAWVAWQRTGNSGWVNTIWTFSVGLVGKEWRWSGEHYRRTALDWLANFDAHRDAIEAALRPLRRRHGAMDAALALVLPRDRGPVRPCRRCGVGGSHHRMKVSA